MRLVVTAFVTRGHTVRFSRCLRCFDTTLAAAVSTACGSVSNLMAAPEVDPVVAEGVRAELALMQAKEGAQKRSEGGRQAPQVC